MSTQIEVSKKFATKNEEVRDNYINYKESEGELRTKINELVFITHEENPDWTLNKIVSFICDVNQDLDGFSSSNVKRNVTDENKTMLTVKPRRPSPALEQLRQEKGELTDEKIEIEIPQEEEEEEDLLKKIVEVEGKRYEVHDIDQGEEEPEGDIVEDPEVIYDNPQKIIKQYEERIIKQEQAYEKLEQEYKKVLAENRELIEENARLNREIEQWKKQMKQKASE